MERKEEVLFNCPQLGKREARSEVPRDFESVELDAKFMEAKLQGPLSKVDVKRRQ